MRKSKYISQGNHNGGNREHLHNH